MSETTWFVLSILLMVLGILIGGMMQITPECEHCRETQREMRRK